MAEDQCPHAVLEHISKDKKSEKDSKRGRADIRFSCRRVNKALDYQRERFLCQEYWKKN